ncbi:hypothetical protein BESB_076750 [Besnoitia besnoiti]|uniref:RNA polymerase III transcription factor (TF)IIIC subunit n=1 Tax=Besnoitia besnoiti TaxID=94643 RepID=A0A2A9M4P7_BESBE|nr:hypothetical protein BESB_076750 [Besnoitia besnoiti]PFH33458.1 hypothetical protein BESB_076750 [Besnoitia besnoiti]
MADVAGAEGRLPLSAGPSPSSSSASPSVSSASPSSTSSLSSSSSSCSFSSSRCPSHTSLMPSSLQPLPPVEESRGERQSSCGTEGDVLLVPDRTFVAVAIPGTVQRKSTALELLGGRDAVASYLASSDEKLFLRTSLQDKLYSRFLPATASRASGLAIRVQKRRSGKVTISVLGRVTKMHTFEALADFYFCPPPGARSPIDFRKLLSTDSSSSSSSSASSSLFIPPPLFCRFSQPANYRLDQLSVAPPSPKGDAATAVADALGVSAAAVPWGAKSPQGPVRVRGAASQVATPADLASAALLPSSSSSAAASASATNADREERPLDMQEEDREAVSQAREGAEDEPQRPEEDEFSRGRERERGNRDEEDDNDEVGARKKARRIEDDSQKRIGEEFNAVARFGDAQFPSQPPPAAMKATADQLLLLRLRRLLEENPIWLRSSLDARLPEEFTAWRKKPGYAKTCFLFADGPWRGCLCRLGYDPRQSPESRFSQTIDFRDPFFRNVNWRRLRNRPAPALAASLVAAKTEALSAEAEARLGDAERDDAPFEAKKVSALEQHFLIAPTRPSLLYQLREIKDEGVQKLLREAPVLPAPCKETGWYTAATMKTLRELLAMKSQRMREKAGEPLPPA